jgi:NAD(P)-dependent dehydrogenase (short-subunit alcohol dehydrogenase family)
MPTALITGCGSLIGEAVARKLAADGWRLVLTDLDLALAQRVADAVDAKAVAAIHKMDVTDPGEVARVIASTTSSSGIDALVNAAGGGRGLGVPALEFIDHTRVQRDKLVDVNLRGLFEVTHAVLPGMIAVKRGAIVSITAARGLRGGPRAAVYSACKAGIIAFTQSLAQEVGRYGIRANTVAPGNTPARWKTPDGERIRSPLGTDTSPDDVGNAVAFLLSDRASHITGSCLDVSGGTALH